MAPQKFCRHAGCGRDLPRPHLFPKRNMITSYGHAAGLQDPAVGGNGNHLQRQRFAAALQRCANRMLQPAAAGHLHPRHGDAPQIILPENCLQLFRIIHRIQLGTSHQQNLPFQQPLMKCAAGIRPAVGPPPAGRSPQNTAPGPEPAESAPAIGRRDCCSPDGAGASVRSGLLARLPASQACPPRPSPAVPRLRHRRAPPSHKPDRPGRARRQAIPKPSQ